MEFVELSKKNVEVAARTDVAVFGGGPAGFIAAVASARMGAKTILIERWPFLGGLATVVPIAQVPVAHYMPIQGQNTVMTAGIPLDLVKQMIDRKKWENPKDVWEEGRKTFITQARNTPDDRIRFWTPHFGFDHEYLKSFLIEFCEKDNVDLLVSTTACDVILDGDILKGVVIANKSGVQAILADRFIDCTGDGDLAAWAGAPYSYTPFHLPESWNWHVANVDAEAFSQYAKKDPQLRKLIIDMIKKGILPPWNEKNPIYLRTRVPGVYPFAMSIPKEGGGRKFRPDPKGVSRMGYHAYSITDITNGREWSNLEIRARKDMQHIMDYVNENVPGFKDAYILYHGDLGTRESRRILCEYQLTREDVVKGNKYDDTIGQSCWEPGIDLETTTKFWSEYVFKNPVYDIPWRCLVPKKVENLVVAGRCFSQTASAYQTDMTRDIDICMILGQAAGIGAALSAKYKVPIRGLNIEDIQMFVRRFQHRNPRL